MENNAVTAITVIFCVLVTLVVSGINLAYATMYYAYEKCVRGAEEVNLNIETIDMDN